MGSEMCIRDSSWRVSWLMRTSHVRYAEQRYDDALEAARAAAELAAATLGTQSLDHERAMLHLAAVHAAMRQNEEALDLLGDCDSLAIRVHGSDSLQRIPILHARAEVLEAADDLAGAVEALGRARAIRRAVLGPHDPAYARSCFNQAGLLVRQANSALVAVDGWRASLVGQAVTLVVEASEIAVSTGDPEQGQEFAEALLELILSGTGGEANRLAHLEGCFEHVERLNEAVNKAQGLTCATGQ